jgi:hypothetical protein
MHLIILINESRGGNAREVREREIRERFVQVVENVARKVFHAL